MNQINQLGFFFKNKATKRKIKLPLLTREGEPDTTIKPDIMFFN